jgi:hypothetical protein
MTVSKTLHQNCLRHSQKTFDLHGFFWLFLKSYLSDRIFLFQHNYILFHSQKKNLNTSIKLGKFVIMTVL